MADHNTGDIARMIDKSPSTVRTWSRRYADHLEPEQQDSDQARVYSDHDAAIFQRVAELRQQDLSHAEINQRLHATDVTEASAADSSPPKPTTKPTTEPTPEAEASSSPTRRAIINCHIHTFTADYVPDQFLPLGLTNLLRIAALRDQLAFVARLLSPIIPEGRFHRFLQFIEVSNLSSQAEVLHRVRGFYPPSTRFIVLPMDMAYMSAGSSRHSLEQQHQELLELAETNKPHVVPFCAVDPRRPQIVELTKQWITAGFRGIKLYPNLGYSPNDPVLLEIYALAEQNNIPIMVHCSPGGIKSNAISRQQAAHFAHPAQYDDIASRFPQLRICLAHFGGNQEWAAYRKKEWHPGDRKSWISIIADLIRAHSNIYTDISYTMFRFRENIPILKIFLTDPALQQAVLFGSDYYMVELERLTEREVSIQLRAELGEALFTQIAKVNPLRYLEGTAEHDA